MSAPALEVGAGMPAAGEKPGPISRVESEQPPAQPWRGRELETSPARDFAAPILLGSMIGAMVAGRYETALACIALALGAAVAAGARWPARSWLVGIAISSALAIGLNLYLTPGQTLGGPAILGASPTIEGLRAGALFALRLIGAALAIHGLRAAWPGERAADELASLLRPLERIRVPVREGRVVIGLALRFVPLLADETRRIAAVQDLRAGGPARGMRAWWARRRAVLVPAMVAALERAEQVALALEARHYRVRPLPRRKRAPVAATVMGWGIAGASLLWRG